MAVEQARKKFKHELVLGIVCPLGTDYNQFLKALENYLQRFGYSSNRIHLSRDFREILGKLGTPDAGGSVPSFRTKILDGDRIRERTANNGALAYYAVHQIAVKRREASGGESGPLQGTCHVVVQLKRPEEVEVLRATYGLGFFLIGLFSTEVERLQFFKKNGISAEEAAELIATDSEEKGNFGQRTTKTFHLADVFISSADFAVQALRFVDLVFGHPFHTPTTDERAMFMAYASSLSSADLSRQVGAAIIDRNGNLIAVGYNEVPKAGGGPYQGGKWSHRDIEEGRDYNHTERERIAQKIYAELELSGTVEWSKARAAFSAAGLYDITEYGRAVHAEMDAILACGRTGVSPLGSVLYTTTFPCHNCTRHIVASGISKVVYVEPYPRSKANELHGDAIKLADRAEVLCGPAVPFVPFIGIGPRRYIDLFSMRLGSGTPIEREREGALVDWEESKSAPRLSMLPSSYIQREFETARTFEEMLTKSGKEESKDERIQKT